jgi:hypothetical protein
MLELFSYLLAAAESNEKLPMGPGLIFKALLEKNEEELTLKEVLYIDACNIVTPKFVIRSFPLCHYIKHLL